MDMNLRKLIRHAIREEFENPMNMLKGTFLVDFDSFPKDVLNTLDSEYGNYEKFDWNSKMDEFSDPQEFNRWVRKNKSDKFIANLDRLIEMTNQDIDTINKKKIASEKLKAFEELIKDSLPKEAFLTAISKFQEDALLNPYASSEDVQNAFEEAKNIIDQHGNIDQSKTTPSKLFGDTINLPQFERLTQENPEFMGVFNDWKKLLLDYSMMSTVRLNSFRDTVRLQDVVNLRDFLTQYKKKNLPKFKSAQNEGIDRRF